MRAISCLLLLAFVRVLNISVPILYKHLIDMLADASSSPSGTGKLRNLDDGQMGLLRACAELATKYSLKDLIYPWTLLYIGAIFFQGGGGGAFMVI